MFRNESNIRTYVDTVLKGGIPVTTGRTVDEEELLAASYATGLRTGRIEDEGLRSMQAARPQLATYYDALVNKLSNAGVLEGYLDDNGRAGLRLSTLGRLFEDEALSVFFSPTVKRALSVKMTGERKLQHA
ncbi:coproporphyrinogen III oxidase-like Fe-S oxidoreductase [Bradyrhizobium sp. USDA 4449]